MTTPSYKLLAVITGLNISRTFSLVSGKRYLLGSAEMEPGMLVFSIGWSLSRRQAWLEIVANKLRLERHPMATYFCGR